MREWDTPEYRAATEAGYEAIRARHPDLVTKRFECYGGWHPILADYFGEVARLLEENPGGSFSLWQVKEKFGGLRLYAQASPEAVSAGVSAAYRKAEDRSWHTCEVCGRDGALRRRDRVYMVRCGEHADGAEPVGEDGE